MIEAQDIRETTEIKVFSGGFNPVNKNRFASHVVVNKYDKIANLDTQVGHVQASLDKPHMSFLRRLTLPCRTKICFPGNPVIMQTSKHIPEVLHPTLRTYAHYPKKNVLILISTHDK